MLAKNIFTRLGKIFHQFSLNFNDTENCCQAIIISKSAQLNMQTTELVNSLIKQMNQEISSLKREAKCKRKEKQRLLASHLKNQSQWDHEKNKLENQIQRCGFKISQLLKELIKKQNQGFHQKNIKTTDQEIQCQLEFLDFKDIVDIYEKQNISLSKVIIQLKQILIQKQEQIQAQKVLICQLIEELSYEEKYEISEESEQQFNQKMISSLESQRQDYHAQSSQTQNSQISSTLSLQIDSQKEDDEDSSTIAGISDTGDRDYALPQWMQFDEVQNNQSGIQTIYQHDSQQHQIWFQILYDKICKKFC